MADNEIDAHTRSIVYRTSPQPRTFKACQTCRQQKSRCIVDGKPPCQRCRAIGRDCVFEEVGRAKRRSQSSLSSDGESSKKCRYSDLEEEVCRLRAVIGQMDSAPGLNEKQLHEPSSPHQRHASPDSPCRTTPNEHGSQGQFDWSQAVTSSEDLKLLRLGAPLTVVHAMISGSAPTTPSSVQSAETYSPGSSVSRPVRNEEPINQPPQAYDDIVSRGLVSEYSARKLFQLYMANGNVFLPLLDSPVDTFETVRRRSTLLFTVIIAIAIAVDDNHSNTQEKKDKCLQEAQNLAANSLFVNAHNLETIQGMLLLSAYSERNWFAISHTFKMSQDNGLNDLLPRNSDVASSETSKPVIDSRRLAQLTRTALLVHQVELEVATGTARQSRSLPVSQAFLRQFVKNKFSVAHDVRIAATVELTQLRDQLLHDMESTDSLTGSDTAQVEKIEIAVQSWFNYWEDIYQDKDFTPESFQRSSLRLQRDYALIIAGSNLIGKLVKEAASETHLSTHNGQLNAAISTTLIRIEELIEFIAKDQAYSWHLRWAPTYSTIFPVFISALAFRLVKMRPGSFDWQPFQSSIAKVAEVLEDSPYQNFATLTRAISKLTLRPLGVARNQRSRNMQLPPSSMPQCTERSVTQDEAKPSGRPETVGQGESNGSGDYILPIEAMGYHEQSGGETTRLPTPLSHYLLYDSSFMDNRNGMQAISASQDFMFDYRSFAASTEAMMATPELFETMHHSQSD